MRTAVLGLGSNLGDRLQLLRSAATQLALDLEVVARSPIYESAPVGPEQPHYLNAALLVRTPIDAVALLELALEVERAHGRTRPDAVRWGPRSLDVDILWIEGEVIELPGLVVPHPRLTERAFALRPLRDVAPRAVDPRTGRTFDLVAPDGDLRVFAGWG